MTNVDRSLTVPYNPTAANNIEHSVTTASLAPPRPPPVRENNDSSAESDEQQTGCGLTPAKSKWHVVLLLVGAALVVIAVALVLFFINSDSNGSAASAKGEDDSEVGRYLRQLRLLVLGANAFRAGAPQVIATEWMALVDIPRLDLEDTQRVNQRFSLLTLYFALGGDDWQLQGWTHAPGLHECSWERVKCNMYKIVTELDLGNEVYATGRMPDELKLLTALSSLDLSENRLEGEIPSTLFTLTHLVFLDLSFNEFVGTIDSDIQKLGFIETLKVGSNFLTGTLPHDALKSLTNMRTFGIESNRFEGDKTWDFVSAWSDIEHIDISEQPLGGSIPTEIGRLSKLASLKFHGTFMTGTIPSEIGNLASSLTFLSASFTSLQGPLPTEIGKLDLLVFYLMNYCSMGGTTIPTEIGRCRSLNTLSLEGNMFSGSLPSELGLLTNLLQLRARNNLLTGIVPSQLLMLTELRSLQLALNPRMTGSIPEEFCGMGNLREITSDCGVVCQCCESSLDTECDAQNSG